MTFRDGIDRDLLAKLARFDTPTICNALEIATGSRRNAGFTRASLVMAPTVLPPFVGFARTATLRAAAPSTMAPAAMRELRMRYYAHVAGDAVPTVVVVQDLDHAPGAGAWWGEVHATIHRALGCVGVVTNGAVRDLDVLAADFPILAAMVTPSHAFVRIESVGGDVDVLGMAVAHDDLIHADRHGAVVIPRAVAADMPRAIEVIVAREQLILDAARRPGFGVADIRAAMAAGDDIH